ncbi:MAG TPA: anti-sigma factor [Vicinamibacterales bacterium]|nr:anti-sigma factor [Vicinamibacterales bacterium]
MTHEEIKDLLPAYALGALDADEQREVSAHVATCAECAAEAGALGRVVEGIGLDAAPVTPPPALKGRVLARIEQEREGRVPSLARMPVTPSQAPAARPFWAHGLALAASLALAVGASAYAWALRSEISTLRGDVAATSEEAAKLRGELASLRRNWVEVTRAMDVLRAPDMLKVDLKGQAPAPGSTGRAFWSRSAGLTFTADNLPALPPGRVYQLWSIKGSVATGAGTFTPDARGSASVTTSVAAGAEVPDAFGVTIEPAGGSATPTMPIVLVGASK